MSNILENPNLDQMKQEEEDDRAIKLGTITDSKLARLLYATKTSDIFGGVTSFGFNKKGGKIVSVDIYLEDCSKEGEILLGMLKEE